ncbi:TRAP transporter substrate-binding protein [Salipiger abyssi]|uniref:TRAP transporter substrate-binding protein n=1 Tax=Salipiger abyssi TaxID=1250539 RepID=UPI001A8FB016|nr:TRAP transporter substrate-binding protein DctP [Salipiger abyssi]MBN9888894.1 TRAP transporter substrate-binding protein DctP [Salipiger abyssi]
MLLKTISFGLAAALSLASAAQATDIRMLKTWDDRYPGSGAICDRFAELATEASGGEISFQMFGPETVPPLEQVDPVRNGVFQVLCTYPNFHTGESTLLAGLESTVPDAEKLRSSGAWDIVDENYRSIGLKTLAIPTAHGLTIFLTDPLSEDGDIAGRSIRGLPSVHPIIESLGGVGVVLPPAEMLSSLERGIIDGALFPIAGAAGFGFAEVTSYYLGDLPYALPHVVLMQDGFWQGLSEADQQALLEAGKMLEDEIDGVYDELNAEEMARLEERGVEEQPLSDAMLDKYLAALREASWTFAHSRSGAFADRLEQAVTEAGLLR